MQIFEYSENADYHKFILTDGQIFNIGKATESNPNGAADYDAAYQILLMNCPELEA